MKNTDLRKDNELLANGELRIQDTISNPNTSKKLLTLIAMKLTMPMVLSLDAETTGKIAYSITLTIWKTCTQRNRWTKSDSESDIIYF